jgi:ubiquinone/menaquinone biosynthesis C-methylase UbiE
MKWNRNEINRLLPILEQLSFDLTPVDGKKILVLCSATGEVAFWLGEMMEQGQVVGLELDKESLDIARRTVREMGLDQVVQFFPAEKDRLPYPDESYDSLVSEFVVYPTAMPTEIGQAEMARVLKPGGKMILTDVIATRPLPGHVRQDLAGIGVDYICDGTTGDIRNKMADAGLVNIELRDLTSTVKMVWEDRFDSDSAISHQAGYSYLLDDPRAGLGKTIFYIYISGEKTKN